VLSKRRNGEKGKNGEQCKIFVSIIKNRSLMLSLNCEQMAWELKQKRSWRLLGHNQLLSAATI
jgi:hypothetical protein